MLLFSVSVMLVSISFASTKASINFSEDDYVTLGGFVGSGIGCSAPEYGYGAAAAADSGPWDICNDQSITIEYVEDPNVSCGGPYPASFSLIKL